MKRTLITLPLLLAGILLTACGGSDVAYDASGIFEVTEVIVAARGSGQIVRMDVEEGQQVDADVALGHIDTTQLHLRRRQLEATLSATDSRRLDEERQLAALRQQIANLEAEQRRFTTLVKANAATQKQLDDIGYSLMVARRQLSATAEQIGSSNSSLSGQSESIVAQVAALDDQIANCVICSPTRGTVLTKYAEEGEYATPGRALFKVGDMTHMRLRIYVTAPQLTELALGQQVTVYADRGETDRVGLQGVITWISDEAEFTPKTIQTRDERSNLVYAVKVSVTNDGSLKRGMYGDVKF